MANPKTGTLTTTFPGPSLPSGWYVEPDSASGNPSTNITVSNGLSMSGGLQSDTGYYGSVNNDGPYDLTGSAVFCKVTPNTSSSDYDTGFAVLASNYSDGYGIGVYGGKMYARSFAGDNPVDLQHTLSYNATSHAWWRIRESSGTIFFETSPDSQTWTSFYTTTTESVGTWTAASSSIQLFYGSSSGSAQPAGTASFADFNTAAGGGGGTGFSPVGSPFSATASTFSLTPSAVGDFILCEVISETSADYATALSSSNVTWSVLVTHQAIGSLACTVFIGEVTSASAATVTVTLAAGSPVLRIMGQEFSASDGYSTVTLDVSGTVDAGSAFPSLTPSQGSGGLYWGYVFDSGTGAAGSTSGYTYALDANGNVMAYNPSCGTGAQAPGIGGSGTVSGVAVLLYQASGPAFNPLVQTATGSATGTSLTLTFPDAVTKGNTVIVATCGYHGGSVNGLELSGGSVTFSHVASSGGNGAEMWANYSAEVSAASVVITATTAGILAWAYEVAGTVTMDVNAGTTGSGTSWSSGATGTTIPYGHFAVGVATTVNATTPGTITATAAGWVNGVKYANVASNGDHVSGVSGYQAAAGSGTYTYSGISGSSASWGAVTAAFLVLPAPGQVQSGWGGYVFNEHGTAGYTGVTATFTIPAVSGGAYNSLWVGLGNVNQVGVYQTYVSGQPGNSSTRPWSWWLPGSGELWNQDDFPTAAGDTLTLTMQLTGDQWLMTIDNVTRGWSYTETKSVLSTNIGSVNDNGAGSPVWPFPLGTAEVIIEHQTANLPQYGSVEFTAITTTPAATQAPYPIVTANGSAVNQYPGAYDLEAGSFTMHYNAAG